MDKRYEYKCCNDTVDIYKVLNGSHCESGCQAQLHGTKYIYALPKHKEQRIVDRIISHQLIIMENPGGQLIDKLEFNGEDSTVTVVDESTQVQAVKGGGSGPSSIVRPSSLNYKISLLDAAIAFV
jgi:hypothetical protein